MTPSTSRALGDPGNDSMSNRASKVVVRAHGPGSSQAGASAPTADGLGAVFTRRWAAELVLDMAGYVNTHDLADRRVLEPSCGAGAFLGAIIDRLAASCVLHNQDLADCENAIRAWDLDPTAVDAARVFTRAALEGHGVNTSRAVTIANTWIREGDFLLQHHEPADWVIGNPPYVRLEDVPPSRTEAYRARWETMQGRADVYVGFIEAGLRALRPNGVLSFICADRWMRNQYGKRLRRLVEDRFAVEAIITLHDSDAFEQRVAAYPAVVAMRAAPQGAALIVDADGNFAEAGAHEVREVFQKGPDAGASPGSVHSSASGFTAAWTAKWSVGAGSWPAGRPDRIAVVADLEERYPALGEPASAVRLGIGIATGADAVYLTDDPHIVEPERLLPLVMAGDLKDGRVAWSGTHLINPWDEDGLVDLENFPRTRTHFERHENRLRGRHVGKRQPERWYRTIDRPVQGLADARKLLVPDLRLRVTPVLDESGHYPHHNLFWMTSQTWDLRVLGGLLLSEFATLFVETYSPRMAGGALRVTAQYLRRVRVPAPADIAPVVAMDLACAFDRRDVAAATAAASVAYGLDANPFGVTNEALVDEAVEAVAAAD